MSNKWSAKGTLLQREVATVMTTVAGVRSIDGPGPEAQYFDGTDLGSGVSMEDGELTGHSSPGEISGELFYDPLDPVHVLFDDDLADPDYWDGQILLPVTDTPAITFTGSTKSFKPKFAVNDGIMADFSIKLRELAVFPDSSEE